MSDPNDPNDVPEIPATPKPRKARKPRATAAMTEAAALPESSGPAAPKPRSPRKPKAVVDAPIEIVSEPESEIAPEPELLPEEAPLEPAQTELPDAIEAVPEAALSPAEPAKTARPPIWKRPAWLIGAAAAVVLVVVLFASLFWSLPLSRALEPLNNSAIVLTAEDGSPIARRGSYKEAPIDVAKLPAYVPGAFVAIEDRRFYSHMGVDPKAIARALGKNAKAGGVSEGGSTITQQLAKNAFLSSDRSLRRKAQEAMIAVYLEAAAVEGRDPVALSVVGLFRRRGLWPARRGPALFRQAARAAVDRRGRHAGRPGQGPFPPGPDQQHRRRPRAYARGAGRHGRDQDHHPGPGRRGRRGVGRREPGQAAHRRLLRRLGPAPGPRLRSAPATARPSSRRRWIPRCRPRPRRSSTTSSPATARS
jgi:hypothetical protein